ncbi:MAG: class I SAM-dependent methyltransferase [Chthoniobacterales bacterium]
MTTAASHPVNEHALPGANLDPRKMPGHWLLARLGKRVLRPGGIEMTRQLLSTLAISSSDKVVEFAPGLGSTARMTLAKNPASYTAVERDATAATQVRHWLDQTDTKTSNRHVQTGQAQKTGLADACASVVYGEAMLSMQSEKAKREIISEAYRLLQPGGRYGIHELSVSPDDLPEEKLKQISDSITKAINHRAVPLTGQGWEELFRSEGFEIEYRSTAPMALLEPCRVVKDEGFLGLLRFLFRLLINPAARSRVRMMRQTFQKNRDNLAAICLVVRKPVATSEK